MMKILTLNSGSSSIKFQLISMPEEVVLSTGIVERIGSKEAGMRFESKRGRISSTDDIKDHVAGLEKIITYLLDPDNELILDTQEIRLVGHRIVHGGDSFSETCLIDQTVLRNIAAYNPMAPLHNPHNLKGVEIAQELFPHASQVAVFDTAFHQSIPAVAHQYAIPKELSEKHKLRAYGFHGTSHSFVVKQATAYLENKASRIISIHLGNGCSITAVKDGKSMDTSLGFGPSNGLIMGTRSGDIDHSLIFYLAGQLQIPLDEIKTLLDKKSGMLGLSGYSDLRDIQEGASKGDEDCLLALHMNAYRIKKYIGAYAAVLNGIDAVIFTAGIGENSSTLRDLVCDKMEYLGLELDKNLNERRSAEIRRIDSGRLAVQILVVPTNEELEIAREAYKLVQKEVN